MRRLRAKRYAVAMTLTMIGVMQHQPLLIVLAQRLIDDWEFRHRVYHDEIPLALGVKLAPHQLSPDKHRSLYRFEQRDMERLLQALEVPHRFTYQGVVDTGYMAFCCLMTRVALTDRTYVCLLCCLLYLPTVMQLSTRSC